MSVKNAEGQQTFFTIMKTEEKGMEKWKLAGT